MKVELFALCDAATDHQGKLNILGTFDQIYVAQVPAVHPSSAVALRVRFDAMEAGAHKINLQFVDPDGQPLFQPLEGNVQPRMAPGIESVAVNLIFNLHRIKFDNFADYQINLTIDDVAQGSLPLRVCEIPKQPR